MTVKRDETTPEAQLRSCVERLEAKNQKLFKSVRAAARKRFPTANELVYDYGHSLVISYSPTQRGIDAVVAIASRADGVFLYFGEGPRLPDPKGLLLGSGKQTRYLPVEAARRLAHPDVEALMAAAVDLAKTPLASSGKGQLVIQSTAARKRRAT